MQPKLPDYLTNPNPSLYLSDNYVVLDWETTNIENGSPLIPENRIVLGCWTVVRDGVRTKKHRFGGEDSYEELLEDISRSDFLVAHNAKFELGWLYRCGYDLASKPIYCTQIGEYVIAGNRKWRLNLNACSERRGRGGKDDLVSKLIKNKVCPSEIPKDWLLKYCEIDVDETEALFLDQRNYHQRHGLAAVMYSRCLFTPVLADMERHGLQLDKDRVYVLFNQVSQELQRLEAELDKFSGGVNWNSTPQMANFLYKEMGFKIPRDYKGHPLVNKETEEWPNGLPKTDAPTLAKLVATNKKQRDFLKIYQKRSKLKTKHTTLEKFYRCCKEHDGILHFQFNQTRTATHRLSSTGFIYAVQGQNLDRDFKPLFRARLPGWLFEEDDAAQLEYRFAVDYADDVRGRADISDGVDVHFLSASTLFPKYDSLPAGAEKKLLRTKAKADTFKPLYYGQSGTPEQVKYYRAFREKHTEISRLQEEMIEQVVQTKQYRTFSGLVFYWPYCRRGKSGYASFSTEICNYFCQNGATAEIIPLGAIYMWHYLRLHNCKSFMVNTVHDSIETEVHPDEVDLIPRLAEQSITIDAVRMLRLLYDYHFTVPLESDSEAASHWSNSPEWEEKYLEVA